jgi:hypothetical protein
MIVERYIVLRDKGIAIVAEKDAKAGGEVHNFAKFRRIGTEEVFEDWSLKKDVCYEVATKLQKGGHRRIEVLVGDFLIERNAVDKIDMTQTVTAGMQLKVKQEATLKLVTEGISGDNTSPEGLPRDKNGTTSSSAEKQIQGWQILQAPRKLQDGEHVTYMHHVHSKDLDQIRKSTGQVKDMICVKVGDGTEALEGWVERRHLSQEVSDSMYWESLPRAQDPSGVWNRKDVSGSQITISGTSISDKVGSNLILYDFSGRTFRTRGYPGGNSTEEMMWKVTPQSLTCYKREIGQTSTHEKLRRSTNDKWIVEVEYKREETDFDIKVFCEDGRALRAANLGPGTSDGPTLELEIDVRGKWSVTEKVEGNNNTVDGSSAPDGAKSYVIAFKQMQSRSGQKREDILYLSAARKRGENKLELRPIDEDNDTNQRWIITPGSGPGAIGRAFTITNKADGSLLIARGNLLKESEDVILVEPGQTEPSDRHRWEIPGFAQGSEGTVLRVQEIEHKFQVSSDGRQGKQTTDYQETRRAPSGFWKHPIDFRMEQNSWEVSMIAQDEVEEVRLFRYTLKEHQHKSILDHLANEQKYRIIGHREWNSRLELRDSTSGQSILSAEHFPLRITVPEAPVPINYTYDWSDHQNKNLWTFLAEERQMRLDSLRGHLPGALPKDKEDTAAAWSRIEVVRVQEPSEKLDIINSILQGGTRFTHSENCSKRFPLTAVLVRQVSGRDVSFTVLNDAKVYPSIPASVNDKDEKDTVALKRGETLTFMEAPTKKNDKDENTGTLKDGWSYIQHDKGRGYIESRHVIRQAVKEYGFKHRIKDVVTVGVIATPKISEKDARPAVENSSVNVIRWQEVIDDKWQKAYLVNKSMRVRLYGTVLDVDTLQRTAPYRGRSSQGEYPLPEPVDAGSMMSLDDLDDGTEHIDSYTWEAHQAKLNGGGKDAHHWGAVVKHISEHPKGGKVLLDERRVIVKNRYGHHIHEKTSSATLTEEHFPLQISLRTPEKAQDQTPLNSARGASPLASPRQPLTPSSAFQSRDGEQEPLLGSAAPKS